MKRLVLLVGFALATLAKTKAEIEPEALLKDAAQIVIGPVFGMPFDPTKEAVARIRDKDLVRKTMESVVGKEPEKIDHDLLLPQLQVAVLDSKGQVIGMFALDRTPSNNITRARVVLRRTKTPTGKDTGTIALGYLLEGWPCKALENYRFLHEEYPEAKADLVAHAVGEMYVHFAGQIERPGTHKISSPATLEELEKACGGWTVFGSANRLTVVRLARPANATLDDPGEPKSIVYEFADIPRDGTKLVLKSGDLIFVPQKQVIGN